MISDEVGNHWQRNKDGFVLFCKSPLHGYTHRLHQTAPNSDFVLFVGPPSWGICTQVLVTEVFGLMRVLLLSAVCAHCNYLSNKQNQAPIFGGMGAAA